MKNSLLTFALAMAAPYLAANAQSAAAPTATAPAAAAAPAAVPASASADSREPASDEAAAQESSEAAEAPVSSMAPVSDIDLAHLSTPPQFAWGSNPFLRTPGFTAMDPELDVISPDKFSLDAVIFDAEDPLAIVNGKTVGVGDRIQGLRVEAIGPSYVLIRGEGLFFELAVPPARHAAQSAEIEEMPEPKEKRK